MKDYVTASQRLHNPWRRFLSEDTKTAILIFVLCISFFVAITQPGVVS